MKISTMNEIAIITGASRGIGHALAIELASRGVTVVAISRNTVALNELSSANPEKIQIITADITKERDQERILSTFCDQKINFLINNAGTINPIGALHKAAKHDIRQLFETNLLAPILLTNTLIPYFHQSGGRILNITSVAGNTVVPGVVAYCSSKAALNMWTAGLKQELPPHIVATDVIPGEVDTEMQQTLRSAPLAQFPLADEFKEAKQQNTLIPISICADFLADILLKTSPQEFSNKRWNIYQDYNKKIPQPLNKKKLAQD